MDYVQILPYAIFGGIVILVYAVASLFSVKNLAGQRTFG